MGNYCDEHNQVMEFSLISDWFESDITNKLIFEIIDFNYSYLVDCSIGFNNIENSDKTGL